MSPRLSRFMALLNYSPKKVDIKENSEKLSEHNGLKNNFCAYPISKLDPVKDQHYYFHSHWGLPNKHLHSRVDILY